MDEINQAVIVLKQGGIVIFPTDTAFGIGCRMDSAKSVEKLFAIRQRPINQATPVLVSSQKMVLTYLLHPVSNNVRLLMNKYWPGALTIVIPCQIAKVPSLVRGSGKNLGVRMPDHEITLKIIEEVGVPILGPSANFHGLETPNEYNKLDKALVRLVDFTVSGVCKKKNVSTVIDCSITPFKIIRQGIIDIL